MKPTGRASEVCLIRAGKYLKPYQGLKQDTVDNFNELIALAGKYLKPYQGLKLSDVAFLQDAESRKIPKTLSGIETL